MKRNSGIAALIAASVFALAAADAQAAVTFNFESPNIGSGAYEYSTQYAQYSSNGQAANVANVTFTGNSGIQSNGSAFGFAATTDGTQTAFIQKTSTGSHTQTGVMTLNLGSLVSGQNYLVSFLYADRGSGNGGLKSAFTVGYGGTTQTYNATSTAFSTAGFSFMADNSMNLVFTASGPLSGDTTTAIDKVVLTAVPEPGMWTTMVGGFAMTGMAMRRRRKNVFRFT